MDDINQMYVIKRDGNREEISFDKIFKRIKWITNNPVPLKYINVAELTQRVIQGLVNNIKTIDIDLHTAKLASSLGIKNYDYLTLASRIVVNNHHKNTLATFSDKIEVLYFQNNVPPENRINIIDKRFYKFVHLNEAKINAMIDYKKDYTYDYFGFKTLEKGYLLSIGDNIIERPQDMIMRAAIQMYMPQDPGDFRDADSYLNKIKTAYENISNKYYTPATPILFNSGSPRANLASCFLLGSEDSLEGIMKTNTDCAKISKYCGGIGVHISMWRGKNALIRGTNGRTEGIVNMLRINNSVMRAFNQGGKRNGSQAIYLEPHHPDIMDFLHIRDAGIDINKTCPDLFPALWISDLFMKRVDAHGKWSTFCPNKYPELTELYGDEYERRYLQLEAEGKQEAIYNASDIWAAIFKMSKEAGLPYMLYKDNVNLRNMQANVGTIKSSNLCAEMILPSNAGEYAVCNLHSICLPTFVEDSYSADEKEAIRAIDRNFRMFISGVGGKDDNSAGGNMRQLNDKFPTNPRFNYKLLAEVAAEVTENINMVIDIGYNVLQETAASNFKHRPIGIGIQGLADVFLKFNIPFDSEKARDINKKISEAIYYGALSRSTRLCRNIYLNAKKSIDSNGKYESSIYPKHILDQYPALCESNITMIYTDKKDIPNTIGAYPSYTVNRGSQLYNDKFNWELYGLKTEDMSGIFDWESLREHIKLFGVRNSVVTAYMPTGSTSTIMGFSPCFEPYTLNLFLRKTIAGSHVVGNKYLLKYLQDNGLYTEEIINYIINNNGSIQDIEGIPNTVKEIFKTAYELKQKSLMQLAIDRQPFIDQSQSMNLFFENYNIDMFSSAQFFGWKNKLKTGSYYIRSTAAVSAKKITIPKSITNKLATSLDKVGCVARDNVDHNDAVRGDVIVSVDTDDNDVDDYEEEYREENIEEEEAICLNCSS
jgi:ribonucleoside-diphosphate reductase alpha chain